MCPGSEFAHRRVTVHGNLKPGNVRPSDDGTSKIAEFGLAVVLGCSQITGERMKAGNVSYTPAEQVRGGEVTP